jgi:hypothetical protein
MSPVLPPDIPAFQRDYSAVGTSDEVQTLSQMGFETLIF